MSTVEDGADGGGDRVVGPAPQVGDNAIELIVRLGNILYLAEHDPDLMAEYSRRLAEEDNADT